MNQWISVKERLPERPQDERVVRSWYLVALKSGCVKSLCFEFERDSWHETLSPVTHWMELPEPPKEE